MTLRENFRFYGWRLIWILPLVGLAGSFVWLVEGVRRIAVALRR